MEAEDAPAARAPRRWGSGAAELAAAKAEQDAIFATADERDAQIAELDGLATRRTRQPRRHDTPTPVLSQAAPVL